MINTTTEKLNSTGGMALVGKILERIQFGKRVKPIGLKYLHVHTGGMKNVKKLPIAQQSYKICRIT